MPVAQRDARGRFVGIRPDGEHERFEIGRIACQAGAPQDPVGFGIIFAVVQRQAVFVLFRFVLSRFSSGYFRRENIQA